MALKDLTGQFSRLFRPETDSPVPVEHPPAALDHSSPEQITAQALGEEGPEMRPAQERLAKLIDAGSVDFSSLRAATGTTDPLLAVAELCSNPAYLTDSMAMIQDTQRLVALLSDGPSSHIRQLAAQRVDDPAELKRLLRDLRGKDKNVYKIIKQKCDDMRAEELRIEKLDSEITALSAALERHGKRPYDATYEASLRIFLAEWQPLESQSPPEASARVQQAIAACRAVIAEHERLLADQAAQAAHQEAVRIAAEEARAFEEEEARKRHEEATLAAAESAKAREAAAQSQAAILAAAEKNVRSIAGLIGKANGALRDGNTGRAAGIRRAIAEKLEAGPAVPIYLTNQVLQLDEKLASLKEWKDYAVAPKRAELIQEMESLIGSAEEPKVLAERIRQLREDWTTISKGIVSDSEADWQRFHQADVAAFQPCREYFEAQSKLRHENLEKRRQVLLRLQAFIAAQSGENPDWRAVATVLREARQEFHGPSPVDRSPGAALQEEFDAAMTGLHASLEAWHEQNAGEKRSLIQRAQLLVNKTDGREAVDGVKHLQQLWKNVGPAQRSQEQKLWNEFRAHCDAVFKKREQVHAEHAAGLAAGKAQAVAFCEEAEKLSALSGRELLEGMAKIPEWRTGFEAIGELPRADERSLRDRFERALRKCQATLAQERARDKENAFHHLLEAICRINAFGFAVSQADAAGNRDTLKADAETFIAGVGTWPKSGAQALKAAWGKAESATAGDLAAHEKALRMLCIRAEILTELASPADDLPLRREYQVQRLMQRMGQHAETSPDELDAMVLEWAGVGPVLPETHAMLLERFRHAREAFKRSGAGR